MSTVTAHPPLTQYTNHPGAAVGGLNPQSFVSNQPLPSTTTTMTIEPINIDQPVQSQQQWIENNSITTNNTNSSNNNNDNSSLLNNQRQQQQMPQFLQQQQQQQQRQQQQQQQLQRQIIPPYQLHNRQLQKQQETSFYANNTNGQSQLPRKRTKLVIFILDTTAMMSSCFSTLKSTYLDPIKASLDSLNDNNVEYSYGLIFFRDYPPYADYIVFPSEITNDLSKLFNCMCTTKFVGGGYTGNAIAEGLCAALRMSAKKNADERSFILMSNSLPRLSPCKLCNLGDCYKHIDECIQQKVNLSIICPQRNHFTKNISEKSGYEIEDYPTNQYFVRFRGLPSFNFSPVQPININNTVALDNTTSNINGINSTNIMSLPQPQPTQPLQPSPQTQQSQPQPPQQQFNQNAQPQNHTINQTMTNGVNNQQQNKLPNGIISTNPNQLNGYLSPSVSNTAVHSPSMTTPSTPSNLQNNANNNNISSNHSTPAMPPANNLPLNQQNTNQMNSNNSIPPNAEVIDITQSTATIKPPTIQQSPPPPINTQQAQFPNYQQPHPPPQLGSPNHLIPQPSSSLLPQPTINVESSPQQPQSVQQQQSHLSPNVNQPSSPYVNYNSNNFVNNNTPTATNTAVNNVQNNQNVINNPNIQNGLPSPLPNAIYTQQNINKPAPMTHSKPPSQSPSPLVSKQMAQQPQFPQNNNQVQTQNGQRPPFQRHNSSNTFSQPSPSTPPISSPPPNSANAAGSASNINSSPPSHQQANFGQKKPDLVWSGLLGFNESPNKPVPFANVNAHLVRITGFENNPCIGWPDTLVISGIMTEHNNEMLMMHMKSAVQLTFNRQNMIQPGVEDEYLKFIKKLNDEKSMAIVELAGKTLFLSFFDSNTLKGFLLPEFVLKPQPQNPNNPMQQHSTSNTPSSPHTPTTLPNSNLMNTSPNPPRSTSMPNVNPPQYKPIPNAQTAKSAPMNQFNMQNNNQSAQTTPIMSPAQQQQQTTNMNVGMPPRPPGFNQNNTPMNTANKPPVGPQQTNIGLQQSPQVGIQQNQQPNTIQQNPQAGVIQQNQQPKLQQNPPLFNQPNLQQTNIYNQQTQQQNFNNQQQQPNAQQPIFNNQQNYQQPSPQTVQQGQFNPQQTNMMKQQQPNFNQQQNQQAYQQNQIFNNQINRTQQPMQQPMQQTMQQPMQQQIPMQQNMQQQLPMQQSIQQPLQQQMPMQQPMQQQIPMQQPMQQQIPMQQNMAMPVRQMSQSPLHNNNLMQQNNNMQYTQPIQNQFNQPQFNPNQQQQNFQSNLTGTAQQPININYQQPMGQPMGQPIGQMGQMGQPMQPMQPNMNNIPASPIPVPSPVPPSPSVPSPSNPINVDSDDQSSAKRTGKRATTNNAKAAKKGKNK